MDTEFAVTGDCDHCEARDVPVRKDTDPYLRDVYPNEENPESWWCETCYDSRLNDV